ncbi:hypothetical protein ACE6H2_027113 [Prunus campanulata]
MALPMEIGVAIAVFFMAVAMESDGRELRPSRMARGGGGRDHVRDVLLLASLLCGITGVALFVASAFVYICFSFFPFFLGFALFWTFGFPVQTRKEKQQFPSP